MTEDEAHRFAVRYKDIWRAGPAMSELEDQFATMDDLEAATRAMTHLRETTSAPPSCQQVREQYRIETRRPQNMTLNACDTCGRAIDDPRRWRHEHCQPRPEITEAIRTARNQLKRS